PWSGIHNTGERLRHDVTGRGGNPLGVRDLEFPPITGEREDGSLVRDVVRFEEHELARVGPISVVAMVGVPGEIAGAGGDPFAIDNGIARYHVVGGPGLVVAHIKKTQSLTVGRELLNRITRQRTAVTCVERECGLNVSARDSTVVSIVGDLPGAVEEIEGPAGQGVSRYGSRVRRPHVDERQGGGRRRR